MRNPLLSSASHCAFGFRTASGCTAPQPVADLMCSPRRPPRDGCSTRRCVILSDQARVQRKVRRTGEGALLRMDSCVYTPGPAEVSTGRRHHRGWPGEKKLAWSRRGGGRVLGTPSTNMSTRGNWRDIVVEMAIHFVPRSSSHVFDRRLSPPQAAPKRDRHPTRRHRPARHYSVFHFAVV